MKLKWFINTIAVALLIMVALLGLAKHDSVMAAQDDGSKIEGLLLDRFSADGNADFIVRFTDQADLSAAYAMDWNSRGEFVYNSLLDTATRSQANAKSILDAAGLVYQTYIAGNDLYVAGGTLAVANELSALPEVYFIRATRTYYIDPVSDVKPLQSVTWSGDFLAGNAQTTVAGSTDATTDWGITDTHAEQVWALGVRGAGIKVANIDTGVQWNHPALVNQFACPGDPGNVDCWEDPSNICAGGLACDNNGHGTHTMGTMVAKDDPGLTYIAGMAPDATWIACKGCETNSCSDTALNACADWILAPGGDPANRPNIVNNSWGGGGGDNWYQAKVQAWVAAGIFPAFSAGNSTGCSSLGSPGDYQESFGTTGHNSSRIHNFAQGPSFFGHDPYTKPNITAPGVSICSTVPTNGWSCGYSGTSMASPHSAGAVALAWSGCPTYVGNVDATFQLLQNNADAPDPSNPACGVPPDGEGTYEDGYGYLNALTAVQACLGGVEFGALDGYVYDQNNNPVEGATVSAVPGVESNQIQAITDPTGYYTMTLVTGMWDVTASKANYTPQTVTGVEILSGQVTSQNFTISFMGAWTQLSLGLNCPDWTRLDMEYYAGTDLAYILGGRSGTVTDGTIYSFNPDTNSCLNTGQTMPVPISNYSIVLTNNGSADLLCTFGGRPAAGGVTSAVQCYNPTDNTVSQVSTLPGVLASFVPGGQNEVGGKVIVFGGFQNLAAPYETNVTYEWDPVTDDWTPEGDLPLGMGYIQSAVVDGKIYAFGGTVFDGTNLNAQTKTAVYDPALGTWDDVAVAELSTAGAEGRAYGFDSGSGYAFAGQIVIAGGGQWPAETGEAFLYDITTDSYDLGVPDLNILRRDHAGFFVPGDPGAMWVLGGRTSAVGYGGDNPPYAPPEYYPVEVTVAEPDIAVEPAELAATLLPDATTTRTITITNNGDAPLDWGIIEVPGVRIAKVPSGDPQRLSPTGVAAPISPNASPLVDVIADGSFEAGTPSPYWTEYSTNFGTPLCDIGCGTGGGTGPRTGSWWAWFGGIGTYEEGYLYQDVTLTPGNAILSFWLETAACDSANDYMAVQVDGTEVFYVDGANPACGVVGYALQTVDLSAWADGGVHQIQFYSEIFATNLGITNFFVDDVALNNDPGVDWLSEDPIQGVLDPGESQEVVVTFDSTGLAFGEYQASLDVNSNDPDTSVINVPVALTVEEVDLGITKGDTPDPVHFLEELTYTLLVTNYGPQDATGVVVVDILPAGVTFVSASAGCSELAGVVTCNVGALASGVVAELTIVVTAPEEVGTLTNTATVTGNELDDDLVNNDATQDTTVIPAIYNIYLPLVMK